MTRDLHLQPLDDLLVDPATARVYEHGWQSWSPARLHDVRATSPRPEHDWQHVMRFRPGTPLPDEGFQAEGLLVVDPGNGEPVRTFSTADATGEVPTLRARLDGTRLVVETDDPGAVDATDTASLADALTGFGDRVRERAAVTLREAPTVWCSWYHYFLDVTEADIVENLAALDTYDLPADVVQVDDGWQASVGDWLELSHRFSSVADLADRIRSTGRRAGIWVAPFIVSEHSRLASEHPDWLHGEAGTNWGGRLHGLDLTRADVRDYLAESFGSLREAGYDYFKLDFLYAGALPGARHGDESAIEAYRSGLRLVREAVGDDAYVLGCGAPILPSVGLVDAMRVSPDTYNPDDPDDGGDIAAAELRGRPGVEGRAWQQGRFWVNDADCAVVRPQFSRRAEWLDVVDRWSGLRSVSDRVADLDAWGLDAVRRLLTQRPPAAPFPRLPDAYEE